MFRIKDKFELFFTILFYLIIIFIFGLISYKNSNLLFADWSDPIQWLLTIMISVGLFVILPGQLFFKSPKIKKSNYRKKHNKNHKVVYYKKRITN